MCKTRFIPTKTCTSPTGQHNLEIKESHSEPNHLQCIICEERFFVIAESQLKSMGLDVVKAVKQFNN